MGVAWIRIEKHRQTAGCGNRNVGVWSMRLSKGWAGADRKVSSSCRF